jgi:hypothetical protein
VTHWSTGPVHVKHPGPADDWTLTFDTADPYTVEPERIFVAAGTDSGRP